MCSYKANFNTGFNQIKNYDGTNQKNMVPAGKGAIWLAKRGRICGECEGTDQLPAIPLSTLMTSLRDVIKTQHNRHIHTTHITLQKPDNKQRPKLLLSKQYQTWINNFFLVPPTSVLSPLCLQSLPFLGETVLYLIGFGAVWKWGHKFKYINRRRFVHCGWCSTYFHIINTAE